MSGNLPDQDADDLNRSLVEVKQSDLQMILDINRDLTTINVLQNWIMSTMSKICRSDLNVDRRAILLVRDPEDDSLKFKLLLFQVDLEFLRQALVARKDVITRRQTAVRQLEAIE